MEQSQAQTVTKTENTEQDSALTSTPAGMERAAPSVPSKHLNESLPTERSRYYLQVGRTFFVEGPNGSFNAIFDG